MKKILSLILAILIAASFVACKKQENDDTPKKDDTTVKNEETLNETDEEEVSDEKEEDKGQEGEKLPEKPAEKPSETPAEKPSEKPQETPAEKTLGNTLLADFKTKANAGLGAEEIASGLLSNPAILFSGVTNPVAPGDYLPGFDEGEITGFKSGVSFMPMIGAIPFVGYVFDLEANTDANAFISTLKKNANLRWLVCAEAEEMVAGSANGKVFFVMCPKSLEE